MKFSYGVILSLILLFSDSANSYLWGMDSKDRCDIKKVECRAASRISQEERNDTGLSRLSFAKGAEGAPIVIIFYFDFVCPPCAKAFTVLQEVMKVYPEEIRLLFKPYTTRPDAFLAHEAAWAAAAQGKFLEMYEKLSTHQGEITPETLLEHAKALKMDLKRFSREIDNQSFKRVILGEAENAKGFGVATAPTFFINGQRLVGPRSLGDFKRIIDKELGLTKTVIVEKELDAPIAPRAEIDVSHAPALGPENAPIVIVEFSDFQCPFCAKAIPTLKEVVKRYPTQVRWLFKHFPLDFHADAPLAHQATLAASQQGKFWEMHDLIFMRQQKMKREDLIGYAQELGLKSEPFLAALDEEALKDGINRDVEEGRRLGVTGTPTFFINGRQLVGAQPIGQFISMIENEMRLGSVKK